jgi:hypothetical protein
LAPTPDKIHIYTTLSRYLVDALKSLATQKGRGVDQLLEEAVLDLLNKYKGASQ